MNEPEPTTTSSSDTAPAPASNPPSAAPVVTATATPVAEPVAESPPVKRPWWLRFLRGIGWLLLWLMVGGCIGWAALATYYSDLLPAWRPLLTSAVVAGSLIVLASIRPLRQALLAFSVGFAILVIWWLGIPPSNQRDWQRDVALLPYADRTNSRVTIHNLRHCDYRSETDFDVHYFDRTYDLTKLRTVDLFVVYWGSPLIAHTMLSFGFEGDDYVCISIETRKEKGEDYSAIKGFFKQYELTYVIADERDVVRVRTNYRGEDVYLYRLSTPPERAQQIFLSYLERANRLRLRAEWYNALTSNCTGNIRDHAAANPSQRSWEWKLLINGFADELVYENGGLDRTLPFAELKARSLINVRAKEATNDLTFSRQIRDGLPRMAKGSDLKN